MDGRGRALDNIFVERLWRSVKYEDVYLRGYETAPELYRGLIRYFRYYNEERPHQGLGYWTPAEVYRGPPETGPPGLRNTEADRRLQFCLGSPPAADGPGGPRKGESATPWKTVPVVLDLGSTTVPSHWTLAKQAEAAGCRSSFVPQSHGRRKESRTPIKPILSRCSRPAPRERSPAPARGCVRLLLLQRNLS